MNKIHNTPKNADQSRLGVTKSKKHDVNLRKNSTIYFQIGLILCLLAVHGLFEMQFETKRYSYNLLPPDNDDLMNLNYVVEIPNVKKVVEKKVVFRAQKPKIVPNITPKVNITEFIPPRINMPNPSTNGNLGKPIKKTENLNKKYPAIAVEKVPIYPGCEKAANNEERLKCMSGKLTKLIQRKFNTEVGDISGLKGVQKINVQFTIDKSGNVTDVLTRAPNALLEEEAIRVMDKVPQMTPGLQRDKPVSVLYSFPIIFKIQN